MRWKKNPTGRDLYIRRYKKFLWVPTTLEGETRWMETATIESERSFGVHNDLREVLDGRPLCRYCENFHQGKCDLKLTNENRDCPEFEMDAMWKRVVRRARWVPKRFIDPLTAIEIEEDPELLELLRQYEQEKHQRELEYLRAGESSDESSEEAADTDSQEPPNGPSE
jgi:hypothetical protein